MQSQGRLIATDASSKRLERLQSNLTRLQVRNAETIRHDWEAAGAASTWQKRFPEGFHRILLDTPCSNTGVIRRRVDVRWRLQPGFLTEITGRQHHLLSVLLPLLRPGGRLVYSTCSIEPEENQQITAAVLAKMPGFRELETRALVPHLSGTDGAWCSLIGRTA